MTDLALIEEAENHLLGDLMAMPHHLPGVLELCGPEHFVPRTARVEVFATIVDLYQRGERSGPVEVHDELKRTNNPAAAESARVAAGWGSAAPFRWARQVVAASTRRRVGMTLDNASTALDAPNADPWTVAETALMELTEVGRPVGAVPVDLLDGDDLAAEKNHPPSEWVLPGLLRFGWRAVHVAFEGRGKSVLNAQLAVGLTHGVQTLTAAKCPALPALIVDLENPREVIAERIRTVDDIVGTPRKAALKVWHRPAGVNLRNRRDRAELESVLKHTRPALVALGPLYKAYRPEGRERDEEAAGKVQAVLDDLRARYGFALLVEHHAPHAEAGSKRAVRPFGSSLWLRWPEFGLALTDSPDRRLSLDVGRFRGDRVKAAWPDRLDRGGRFPWTGFWKDGGV